MTGWKSPFSIGNASSTGPFSMAMLVYQRVSWRTPTTSTAKRSLNCWWHRTAEIISFIRCFHLSEKWQIGIVFKIRMKNLWYASVIQTNNQQKTPLKPTTDHHHTNLPSRIVPTPLVYRPTNLSSLGQNNSQTAPCDILKILIIAIHRHGKIPRIWGSWIRVGLRHQL